ncbi:MAG: hypothetical protein LBO67_00940 [Spirochaetaceae bacterium]|jgi:hypothetical protein|nr:hypothetical protein [Spirochaetaceae bacterium]
MLLVPAGDSTARTGRVIYILRRHIMIAIISVLSLFVVAPTVVFSFIYHLEKNKNEIRKLQIQKEILALELEKEKLQLLKLEAESKQYDRLING